MEKLGKQSEKSFEHLSAIIKQEKKFKKTNYNGFW